MANLWTSQHAGPRNSINNSINFESYISGYFDGEGCFCVAISPRAKLRVGWEVRPSVSVSQNADRAEVLELVSEYFGCGTIRPDPGDQTVKWETRRLVDIVERVLPHFKRYPLISGKRRDVDRLVTICQMMLEQQHLGRQGLLRIVEIAALMNPSGSRRYSIEQIEASAR